MRFIIIFSIFVVGYIQLSDAKSFKSSNAPPGTDIQFDTKISPAHMTAPHGSTLHRIQSDGDVYNDAPYLMNLKAGTAREQGYDMAVLLGREYVLNMNRVATYLLGDHPVLVKAFFQFLDSQWEYLKQNVPNYMFEEFDGMTDASNDLGLEDVGLSAKRSVVLSNFPSDLDTFKYILIDERRQARLRAYNSENISEEDVKNLFHRLAERYEGLHCSNFGVWGSRTEDGRLFSGRNLDWLKDIGLSQFKLITIHHPENGITHASVGWAGVWGALSGMSAAGITVHEANLESVDSSFLGFPWMLRLRDVMKDAHDLDSAMKIWNASTNTVGFNHGFGSAKDGKAVLLETMHHHTAMFSDNDAREQDVDGPDGDNIANPRKDAVYRANHGYDPYTLRFYAWNTTTAYKYSIERYMTFPDVLDNYHAKNILIGPAQAVNMTAIAADTGRYHLYDCDNPEDSGSVLSTTYDPVNLDIYVAWENGHEDSWTAAACNTYLKVSLKKFFEM